MSIRANKIILIGFFSCLVLLLVFTIQEYRAHHRRSVANLKRIEALNNLVENYLQMLAAASRDEPQKFSDALEPVFNQNITIRSTFDDIGDPELEELFSHTVLTCVNRADRFRDSVRDHHRANPSLALPEPIPQDLQNCLFPVEMAPLKPL